MAIPTSRAAGKGNILIDEEKCTGCGTCALVCKDGSLEIREQKAVASDHALLGCIACGHCMAVCPMEPLKFQEGLSAPLMFSI